MVKKVVILGGGVAGLSAAHALVERGFAVEVYESKAVLGGKARSNHKPGSASGQNEDLPGEHGFRFFPGFYHHVIDTMKGIPTALAGHTAADNLTGTSQVGIARKGLPLFQLPVVEPHTPAEWQAALHNWFGHPSLGIPRSEVEFFALKMLEFISSCNDRRLGEYELVSWWDFVEAASKSQGYQDLLARGLTRSLVAMQAETASTRTVATILWQMLLSITNPLGPAADRVLNAPTNAAWIDPWRSYLLSRGVQLHTDTEVEGFSVVAGRIASVQVRDASGPRSLSADFYISAVPVEVMSRLASPALVQAAPSLARLANLHTDWMNGMQFYLNRDVKVTDGHLILVDSPWALTAISQAQFWPGVDFSKLGNGTVKGILSVDISDWHASGQIVQKAAQDCTLQEIKTEVWRQLQSHFLQDKLQDSDLVDYYLDPAIVIGRPNRNLEPLLINTVGSWAMRPQATTGVPNLFLASDYVQTNTQLACMEGANEAARRAVNGVLLAAGATGTQPCAIWELQEPHIFNIAKDLDQLLWDATHPHAGVATLQKMFGWLEGEKA